ncbi:hypothetical protein [Afifella pfennigii]|uniref:hypothetical protein n=1 Tax=Afifella pfennigii TaxID=209897 RepID=UPI0012EBCD12|nr:hypothetical protein [Afifella pfennigii]
MKSLIGATFLLTFLGGAALAGVYSPPPPRGGGPCEAGFGPWRGTYSGTSQDPFNDWVRPVSAQACFPSEYLCRRWLSEVQTWAVNPGLMKCRRVDQ